MATGGFANRDIWMAAAFRKTLQEHPTWRVLIFMGGYHGLKQVGGQVAMGRVHDRFDHWFAGYLADDGTVVYTILTDARQAGANPATRMFDRLSPEEPESNFAVMLDSTSDEVREPIYDVDQEGFRLEFLALEVRASTCGGCNADPEPNDPDLTTPAISRAG